LFSGDNKAFTIFKGTPHRIALNCRVREIKREKKGRKERMVVEEEKE
jgi:hypothetical protein